MKQFFEKNLKGGGLFKQPRKKLLIILLILIIICGAIGISYAYWRFVVTQTGTNRIASSCLELTLTNEENAINIEKAYPLTDEQGRETTPYSFTVENTCDLFASYTITLEVTKESTLDASYVASMLNTNAIQTLNELETTEVSDSNLYKEAYILGTGSLGTGDSEDYALRLWLDEEVTIEDDVMNKSFQAKVVITYTQSNYSPVENGITTLHDAILANEYQTTDIEVAKEKIAAKQQPDFSKTAPIIDWQESHESTASSTYANMADPADVDSGKDYAINLTDENVYPAVGTSYTFDSETGYYTIHDLQYVDPTTLDYENNDYYFNSAFTDINSSGVMNPYTSYRGPEIWKVTGVTKKESILTDSNGQTYPAILYTFTGYQYTQTELESDKSDKGLYALSDDYGTSYYYRGSVKNNYVQFAGYYWRIVRINGDGSIRLLYAGETPDATGQNLGIGLSKYNDFVNKPLYVGYMYGNPDGTTLDEVNANTNDSIMKTYLENWYSKNLSEYSEFIADSGFCNDRTLASYSWNGDGINTNTTTSYASSERYDTYTPSLACPSIKRDLFTVSSEIGNQSSMYPIGLITSDELNLAGYVSDYLNPLSYVSSSYSYWSLTPGFFLEKSNSSTEAYSYYPGYANFYGSANSNFLVRPVINLNANVEIESGIGTQNEPYLVKTS